MEQPPEPPEFRALLKRWWFWVGFVFTVLSFIHNTVKWTPSSEPEWYRDFRKNNIGFYVFIAAGAVWLVPLGIYFVRWIKYRRMLGKLVLKQTISTSLQDFFGSDGARNSICNVGIRLDKLGPDLVKIFEAMQCIGPKAEERLFAVTRGIHDINESYRNHMMSHREKGFDDLADRRPFLEQLCARAAKIFSEAWQISNVVVTVKRTLKDKAGEQQMSVFTFARSCVCEQRDGDGKMNYAIEKNTAFGTASTKAQNGRYCYFSNDLRKEKNYRNERRDRGEKWEELYLSTIVVPIQCLAAQTGARDELMGFLTVDSLQTEAFNETGHLYLLAALADQLFNYFWLTDEQNSRIWRRRKKNQSSAR